MLFASNFEKKKKNKNEFLIKVSFVLLPPGKMAESVCAILDMEAFSHKSFIRFREMGFISLDRFSKPINYQISPGFLPLQNQDMINSFSFQQREIHGLTFFPKKEDRPISFREMKQEILRLWREERTSSRFRIAFKSGCLEKHILSSLNIPSFDLETIGVKPFHKSIDPEKYSPFSCGKHFPKKLFLHCPNCEVMYYRDELSKFECDSFIKNQPKSPSL